MNTKRLLLVAWLVVVWDALWGNLSVANVASGAAVAAFLVALFPPVGIPSLTLRPLAALRFLGYFARKLVEANAVVAWEVVTPRNRIREGIVAVPIQGASPALVALVANAVSLTPGTLTIEVGRAPAVLYVHVLHLHDPEAVRRDVRRLERLAVRAFGDAQAVAALGSEGPDDNGAAGSGPARAVPASTNSKEERP